MFRTDPFTLKQHRKALLWVLLGAAFSNFWGCDRRTQELRELEGNAAAAIYRALDLYEGLHPTIEVTNLPQVFNGATELSRWHILHPAFFDREFRKFGKYAGFTNSFYEKYVRVPANVTNHAFPTEAMFMNSQPVPDYDGGFGRYVIWREGPQYHRSSWVPEEQIQEAFRRAGVPIPKPTPMPKPPVPEGRPYIERPLSMRVRLFFRDLVGPAFADELMWICFGAPIASAVVLVIWLSRRRSRQ
jgi:hypothetical protein